MGPIKALGGILAPKAPKATPATSIPSPPKREDPTIAAAAADSRKEARKRAGRGATIATSALGDTSAAPVGRKELLGQ